jgi:hypothetical protein
VDGDKRLRGGGVVGEGVNDDAGIDGELCDAEAGGGGFANLTVGALLEKLFG